MRNGSRWSLAGVVGLVAVVSLLVMPALGDGPVYGDVGVLRLHLNSDGDRLVYTPTTGDELTQTLSQSNCKLASSGASLLSIVGSGSLSIKKPFAGLKEHRIGVGQTFEGTGEPCARINKDLGQVLTLSLTGSLAGKTLGYAEIDLGFKYNGSATLLIKKGTTLVDTVTVLCNGLSDCGPDSGGSDNERVILYLVGTTPPPADTWQSFPVKGVFDTIVIKPGTAPSCATCKTTTGGSGHSKDSAVSLEGGLDGAGAAPGPVGQSLGTNDTVFKVVAPFDGDLACGEKTPPLVGDHATTEITRGNDAISDGCKGPVNGLLYNFDSGVEGDRLFVDMVTEPVPGSEAVAQFLETITWTYDNPPDVPGGDPQQRTLFYDDHVDAGERVMPWCLIDPRGEGGALAAGLDPETVLPDPVPATDPPHTSCLIASESHVTMSGAFVTTHSIYNIGDGKRGY